MWKMPWHVLGSEAYSDQVFANSEECLGKYKEALLQAQQQVHTKRLTVGKYLIFRQQVVALPPPYFDQRNMGVGDIPGTEFDRINDVGAGS